MNAYITNVRKFYVASILSGFAVFYNGVDTLFFRHFDLSFEQIGFLISANLATILLFEIPTGSFADLYGKKHSILIGSFFTLTGLGFLAFGSNFAAFAIGFILLGIGRSFRSGAESALLYDWLSEVDKQHEYIKHQSRIQAAFVGIDIISGSVGVLLFSLNVRIPFMISFASMVLVILVQFTLKDSFIKKHTLRKCGRNLYRPNQKGLSDSIPKQYHHAADRLHFDLFDCKPVFWGDQYAVFTGDKRIYDWTISDHGIDLEYDPDSFHILC